MMAPMMMPQYQYNAFNSAQVGNQNVTENIAVSPADSEARVVITDENEDIDRTFEEALRLSHGRSRSSSMPSESSFVTFDQKDDTPKLPSAEEKHKSGRKSRKHSKRNSNRSYRKSSPSSNSSSDDSESSESETESNDSSSSADETTRREKQKILDLHVKSKNLNKYTKNLPKYTGQNAAEWGNILKSR